MHLSSAILLGSTLAPTNFGDIQNCALGMAANAIGLPEHDYERFENSIDRYEEIRLRWPWLEADHDYRLLEIMRLFDQEVQGGDMTLEHLVVYIKSIEPSCGQCNDFGCICDRLSLLESQLAIALELEGTASSAATRNTAERWQA